MDLTARFLPPPKNHLPPMAIPRIGELVGVCGLPEMGIQKIVEIDATEEITLVKLRFGEWCRWDRCELLSK
jgi:hypothetical protein